MHVLYVHSNSAVSQNSESINSNHHPSSAATPPLTAYAAAASSQQHNAAGQSTSLLSGYIYTYIYIALLMFEAEHARFYDFVLLAKGYWWVRMSVVPFRVSKRVGQCGCQLPIPPFVSFTTA